MDDKYIVKYSVCKATDLLYLAIALGLVLIQLPTVNTFLIIVCVVWFLYLLYRVLKRWKNRNPQIIIDSVGIELRETNALYKWKDINYAFVKPKVELVGRSVNVDYFLHIITTENEVIKNVSDLRCSAKSVKKAVEYYSGRDIGDYMDVFRDDIIKVIGNVTNPQKIMKLFSIYRIIQYSLAFLLLFVIICISIDYQMDSDFMYCIAVGFVVGVFTVYLTWLGVERLFLNNSYVRELNREQYERIAFKYQVKFERNQKIEYLTFLSIITVVIFLLSYYS